MNDTKWEYIVRTTSGFQLEKCLNTHGYEGWEAFAVISSDQDRLYTVTFKRVNNNRAQIDHEVKSTVDNG